MPNKTVCAVISASILTIYMPAALPSGYVSPPKAAPMLPNTPQLLWRRWRLHPWSRPCWPLIWVLAYFFQDRKYRSVWMSETIYHCKSSFSHWAFVFVSTQWFYFDMKPIDKCWALVRVCSGGSFADSLFCLLRENIWRMIKWVRWFFFLNNRMLTRWCVIENVLLQQR